MATITEYLEVILDGKDLTFEQAKALQDRIFEGQVSEVQIAAFLAVQLHYFRLVRARRIQNRRFCNFRRSRG